MRPVTALLTLSLALSAPTAVAAQGEDAGELPGDDEDEATPLSDSILSLSLGLDMTNAYFFRGELNDKGDVIAQPWIETYFAFYEGDTTSLTLKLGLWNSIHTNEVGEVAEGEPGVNHWYEADIYAGLIVDLPADLSLDLTYYFYTSPAGSFTSIDELALTFSWDDSGLYGAGLFGGIQPSLLVAHDFAREGTYLGVGIEPTLNLLADAPTPLTISFPIDVGLSLADYYLDPDNGDNSVFGYVQFGVKAAVGISSIPASWGAWSIYAKGQGLLLGDGPKALTAEIDNPEGDAFHAILTFGLGIDFE